MVFMDFDAPANLTVAARLLDFENDRILPVEIAEVYRCIRAITPRDVELANGIVAEAGDYLSGFEIQALVRADLSDHDAATIVAERKVYVERLSDLLISVISLFHIQANGAVFLAAAIDQCAREYQIVVARDRKDKVRRKLINESGETLKRIKQLISDLERMHSLVSDEYKEFRPAFYREAYEDSASSPQDIESLRRDLELLFACTELCVLRGQHRAPELWINDSGGKRHIVETAHDMSKQYSGPKFVTTPNSDFARLCGMLFELSTGKPDESFAGAISSYARSAEKKRWDAYEEAAKERESQLDLAEDNFCETKEETQELLERIDTYMTLAKTPNISPTAQHFALMIIRELLDRAERLKNTYGPNLVFASRIRLPPYDGGPGPILEMQERLRQLSIEIGAARRDAAADRGK